MTERKLAASGSPFESTIGFSRAVRLGDRVVVSGTAPIWPDGSCDADAYVQARRCLEIILAALAEVGAKAEDVIRTRMFITDAEVAEVVGRAHGGGVRCDSPGGNDGGGRGLTRSTLEGGDRS